MNWVPPKKSATAAFLAAALIWSAPAEQAIIFSKPADASGSAKADSNLAPETRHETRSLFSLPPNFLEVHPSSAAAAGGPVFSRAPAVSAEQAQAWQKVLENKKKWALMTPEEILGVPTPEKILGLPSKNGDDKLSIEERFVRRQERREAGTLEAANAKSSRQENSARSPENLFARKPFESVFARPEDRNPATQAATTAGKERSLFSSLVSPALTAGDRPEIRWGNTFKLPAQPPKATPEQLAGMDRFRQTLQPSAVFEKAAQPLRAQAAPRKDPFMDAASDFNPRGSSFTPLKNDTARPHGLTPLPGLTYRPPPAPVRSPMQPELPPWMRDETEKKPKTAWKF